MAHRNGLMLILVGLGLAGLTSVLVMGIVRQATEASRAPIRQVALVAASRDIVDQTTISPDALVVKAFPADFAPAGAVATVEESTGKYAVSKLFKDSVLLRAQLSGSKKARDVASNLPPGKVAFWLPLPDLLASTGGVKPGDRIDVLLTVNLAGGEKEKKSQSTQTTLQNIEVFRIGQEELNLKTAPPPAPAGSPPVGAGTPARANQPGPNAKAISFLVDHQDAVIIKFVKDSGGTIDLVLRSSEDQQVVRTDPITLDSLAERFRFRVPQAIMPQQAAGR